MGIHRYGVLSDTHAKLHPAVLELFDGVEAILHAGDVGDEGILDELQALAPVHAVCGNVDIPSAALPLMKSVPLPFGIVSLAHGHEFPQQKDQRSRALHKAFEAQKPRVIISGHSHQQYLEFYKDAFLLNPGAAGLPRFNYQSSVCIIEWTETTNLLRFDFVPLLW